MTVVVRDALPWRLRAEEAARIVRGDRRPFALIGDWAGGGALIGSEPVRLARADEDPFGLLDEQPALARRPDGVASADGVVGGGWFGYLGYELRHRVEEVGPGPPPSPGRLPRFALAFYDHLLRLDADGRWWFEALWTDAREAVLRSRRAELRARVPGPGRPFATAPWSAQPGDRGHAVAVAACRERIRAGDIFQANVCRRLQSQLVGDPLDLFVAAVPRLAAGRAAYVAGDWGAAASLSPELFLARRGRRVRSAPIKGTGRSGAALGASAKDRAENVMIVDLVRNDLGRVCLPGSIEVPALARGEAHTGVWHLVSEVSGVLREGVGDGDLVRATFPPGSVTGAPKVAAIDVIAELESSPRAVYTGAIGFCSPAWGLELSVAIRTFEVSANDIWLGVGGGIVADSDPLAELAECDAKAAPLLEAIGARRARGDSVGGAAPLPVRLAARPVRRPDPRAGVFETILVGEAGPVGLARHLERLAASLGALYGQPLPDGLAGELAGLRGPARLRVSVRPGGPAVVELAPLPAVRPAVHLARLTVPGGIGGHKWCDRGLIDALTAAVAPAQPLICDLDGRVLEAARANLFVVAADGGVVTPPAAGRLLPGVTRARVIGLARRLGLTVRCAELGETDLYAAAEVFVTASIGGVEPVESCDGRALGPGREVTDRLARALDGSSIETVH